MKKILFIFLISFYSFSVQKPTSNGMDFLNKKKKENVYINKEIQKDETGDIKIEDTNEKININVNFDKKNKINSLNKILNKLVKTSYSYLNVPYLWGGTTRNGIDCSAFVKNVYKEIGVIIPRVSRHQATVGKIVNISQMKKGDLIFFETDPKRPNVISHVGMYIGNNKMIHASSGSDKVVIVDLSTSYFMQRLRVIKRIIDIK